ncbi:MAG: hypothetical protein JO132_16250 [Streptosporangiaceae bacterium]|nr:hypothetical protein [Streptosporangiaceae bacterium]
MTGRHGEDPASGDAICLYVLPDALSPPSLVRKLVMAAAVVVTVVTGPDYVLQAARLRRSAPAAGAST